MAVNPLIRKLEQFVRLSPADRAMLVRGSSERVRNFGPRADVSREEAAAAAQRVATGRVLSVDKTEADRRPVWRVKVLTAQGEVRVILIDAASGRVVG